MESDLAPPRMRGTARNILAFCAVAVVAAAAAAWAAPSSNSGAAAVHWLDIVTPPALFFSVLLLVISGFTSASEVAFLSLHTVQLRAMRESGGLLDSLVARLMDHPGNLLTSILMGNCVVNVLLGVVLAPRIEELFALVFLPPSVANPVISYTMAVVVTTGVLLIAGEIAPKILVMSRAESFARAAAVPMFLLDTAFLPLRSTLMTFLGFLFRVTRFSEVPPAPFMTDDEFRALLSEGEASGVIEEDERQMIQGILEFGDVTLREILVPRKDMLVLEAEDMIDAALALVRDHEVSRIPVIGESMDDVVGVIHAKDLLPYVMSGTLGQPIKPLLRRAHFVPETMSVADFVKSAQRLHSHLAIVVDEYGGTEGMVTLHDALREVVGDIDEDPESPYTEESAGVFCVDGAFPLSGLPDLVGAAIEAEEHTTVAGFLLERIDGFPEAGMRIEHEGMVFEVDEADGRRIARVRIHVPHGPTEGNAA